MNSLITAARKISIEEYGKSINALIRNENLSLEQSTYFTKHKKQGRKPTVDFSHLIPKET